MILLSRVSLLLGLLMFYSYGWHSISGVGKTAFAFEISEGRISWSRLSYRAESILGKVTTEVHLRAVQVSRKISAFGKVDIRLQEVNLTPGKS